MLRVLLLSLILANVVYFDIDCQAVIQDVPDVNNNVIESEAELAPTIHADVVYGHKMGLALTMDVIQPQKQNGAAVIFVVSGGWNSGWFPPKSYQGIELLDQLEKHGYTVILLRHGSAPLFKVPDAVSDVKKAVQFLHRRGDQYGLDATRIGVCGQSAGGHLSLMLGTDTNQRKNSRKEEASSSTNRNSAMVAAVVAYFPPTDLRQMIGPSTDFPALDFEKRKGSAVSPILHVTPDDAPTLLVHGTKDKLVPIHHSEEIKKKFDAEGVECQLETIENAGHGFWGRDGKRATKAAFDWFEKHLNVKK